MSSESRKFLSATVLNDGKIVSYRSLSREIKVHNNVAKQLLFDFYHRQIVKKPGSVHATYLVSGILVPADVPCNGNIQQEDGDDALMQSSPFVSSQVQPGEETEIAPPVKLITLVREEDLEEAKARYNQKPSIHIYSLGPSTSQAGAQPAWNLQILSDCNRAISEKFATEDPLVYGKQYGVIQNFQVKRRSGRRPIMSSAPENTVKAGKQAFNSQETRKLISNDLKASTVEPSVRSQTGGEAQTRFSAKTEEPRNSDKKTTTRPPIMRKEQSDIFKSFSKPKAKFDREDTGSSAGASTAASNASILKQDDSIVQEDGKYQPMKDVSEDEQEDNLTSRPTRNPDPKKSKAERTEQLRKMMEDEDDGTETAAEDLSSPSQDSMPLDAPPSQTGPSPDPPVVVTGGRRRGRRKVTKKKTIKDEEGYLVTKEEPVWESFSEDEAPPQKEKTPASTASSMGKGKNGGAKVGQGNILSFFGKR